MSINLEERHEWERRVIIPCGVGCLRHVIGITWFRWGATDGLDDEPELYFETLHEPYERFWMRLWRAWQFVVQKKPYGVDSTVITARQAQNIIDACRAYQDEWIRWEKHVSDCQEQLQKGGNDSNG